MEKEGEIPQYERIHAALQNNSKLNDQLQVIARRSRWSLWAVGIITLIGVAETAVLVHTSIVNRALTRKNNQLELELSDLHHKSLRPSGKIIIGKTGKESHCLVFPPNTNVQAVTNQELVISFIHNERLYSYKVKDPKSIFWMVDTTHMFNTKETIATGNDALQRLGSDNTCEPFLSDHVPEDLFLANSIPEEESN